MMKKAGEVIGKIFAILVAIAFLYNLTVFTFTDDIKSGIWVAIIILSMHVSINVKEAD